MAGDGGELEGHLLCAIPFPEPTEVTDRIRRRFPRLRITYRSSQLSVNWDKERLLPDEIWKDVTILCSLSEFPREASLAPSLKLVHLICVGTDHIWDLPFYQEAKVPITTSSGVAATPIAEWVIMTSLIASRKYNTLHEWQKQHAWDDVGGGKALFQSVTDNVGKRMGILGYGAIGRQVGRLAKAMGMDVVVFTALSRNTPESRRYQGYVVPGTGDVEGEVPSAWHSGDKQSLHHFLSQDLDQLLVSVSLTQKTKSMLGKEEFEILAKKNAFLINVSRGDILVQEDLIKALRHFENTGKGLRGAALDVTTPEPLEKDHPLWDAPNCIITPHMSCVTQDYGIRALEILEINLERLAKGRDLINVVDRERGYASNVNQKQ